MNRNIDYSKKRFNSSYYSELSLPFSKPVWNRNRDILRKGKINFLGSFFLKMQEMEIFCYKGKNISYTFHRKFLSKCVHSNCDRCICVCVCICSICIDYRLLSSNHSELFTILLSRSFWHLKKKKDIPYFHSFSKKISPPLCWKLTGFVTLIANSCKMETWEK